jgi:hypothetical protein
MKKINEGKITHHIPEKKGMVIIRHNNKPG